MMSDDPCRMAGIEDVGTVGLDICGQTDEDGFDSLQMPVCGSVGGGGNLYGSKMGYHGSILLKTNDGTGEAEIEGII